MSDILKGQVAIVTGGASGIGKGIATALIKAGASVVITDISKEQLEVSRKELSAFGDVFPMLSDGSKEEDVIRVVKETVKKYGKINVLVNNAHASKPGINLEDVTMAEFELSFGTGFFAAFFYMKHCFPYLKENQGRVINMSSGSAIFGQFGQTSYAAAKEAIRGMSRVAATEWGQFGITVNIILPFAETPTMLKWKNDMPEAYEAAMAKVPMHKLADPEINIGGLVVFLASEAGSNFTGQNFGADGGSTMRP